MGLLTDAVRALLPATKNEAVGAVVPTWDIGRPQYNPTSYERNAREGYLLDELVYACVEVRATSAAEPKMAVYRNGEKLEEHDALDLLNHPNEFMDSFTLWASVMMHLDIGGNAYLHKVRSGAGRVVELWSLRPDRLEVIPDATDYVRGYKYTLGDYTTFLPANDVIHFKNRHPLNDYYGLAPLSVLAQRVDLDVWQRQFVAAFFKNAGIPAGLLNIKRTVTEEERQLIRQKFRMDYGGSNVGGIIVIDEDEAHYEPMGLPLGGRGTAIPELDIINEARIMGAYQVPPSLIPSQLGGASSSYANRVSDREFFWEGTLAPIYVYLSSTLTMGLAHEFSDVDEFKFDLNTVRALQEDQDKLHTRVREDFKAGLVAWKESRLLIGLPEEPESDPDGVVLVPSNLVPTPWQDMVKLPEPDPMTELPPGQDQVQPQPQLTGRTNGAAH